MKQLMYEIGLLEKEPQWVPAKWVKVIILAMRKIINSQFTLNLHLGFTPTLRSKKTEEDNLVH